MLGFHHRTQRMLLSLQLHNITACNYINQSTQKLLTFEGDFLQEYNGLSDGKCMSLLNVFRKNGVTYSMSVKRIRELCIAPT